ncbi:unnamed protein product, partial [Rotaria magnacalcarata]
MPIHARLRSPPETPLIKSVPINVSAHDSSPRSKIICATLSARSTWDTLRGRRIFAENIRFSRT